MSVDGATLTARERRRKGAAAAVGVYRFRLLAAFEIIADARQDVGRRPLSA